jgi:GNAT superfamily N-acetyltransferase
VKTELSPAELRYLTEIDHRDHEALGVLSRADGRGVGIARYIRGAGDPQVAEVAVTVIDEWQGGRLGTALLPRLPDRARAEGIRRLTALASADNAPIAGLLRGMGARPVGRDSSLVEYDITLSLRG